MFLSGYEKSRKKVLAKEDIATLVQLSVHGYEGIAAQVFAFTLIARAVEGYRGGYIRLNDYDHHSLQEPKTLEAIQNPDCGYFYRSDATNFKSIPGTPIAYWASEAIFRAFREGGSLKDYVRMPYGFKTGDNNTYLRLWWEVSSNRQNYCCATWEDACSSSGKWFPYNKGGQFRCWYGNREYVFNYANGGAEVLGLAKKEGRSVAEYDHSLMFRPVVSWSRISSGKLAMRYSPAGACNDMTGPGYYGDEDVLSYLQGLCNSSIVDKVSSILSATLDFQPGQIGTYPVIESDDKEMVVGLVWFLRTFSRADWDSLETSWDFKRNPLV